MGCKSKVGVEGGAGGFQYVHALGTSLPPCSREDIYDCNVLGYSRGEYNSEMDGPVPWKVPGHSLPGQVAVQ